MKSRPDYTLDLRALADNVPADVRLGSALKTLLRRFGLRCMALRFHDADQAPTVTGSPGSKPDGPHVEPGRDVASDGG